MKRYSITPDTEAAKEAYGRFEGWDGIEKEICIKIDEVADGRWVRYEDIKQYVELTDAQKHNAGWTEEEIASGRS